MNKNLLLFVASCMALNATAQEKIILVNEGLWQNDNGRLTYFDNGTVVSNKWFSDVNGTKLGDTPNDIIQIDDDIIAITLSMSNLIQFIDSQGNAIGAIDDIPDPRKMASDGSYLYVTSYAHDLGQTQKFEKGYVAKIDVKTLSVVDAVEVGYEPEGIVLYDGHLFIANTGGYSFQENHDYESTVSIVDAATMTVVRTIDTHQKNLYKKVSLSGRYMLVNSPGDYYSIKPASIIVDCRAALDSAPDVDCYRLLDIYATYNCTAKDGRFYAVGSEYSFLTDSYEYNYSVVDPSEVFNGFGGVYEQLPGSVSDDLKSMTTPYGIYVNPYTGYIYATDAGSYGSAGTLYQWSPQGSLLSTHKVYINPGHFLALPPDGHFNSIADCIVDKDSENAPVYNLQGIRVATLIPGQIYIRRGHKFVAH